MTDCILLLDIGNTRAKAALWQEGTLSGPFDFPANLPDAPVRVLFASVANDERLQQLKAEMALEAVPWQQVCSGAEKNGLRSAYAKPETLGVDRWLAMLGARVLLPATELLVVDAGTALTVDHLDATGQHLGGWIVPGIRLQQKAVTNYTARVFNRDEESYSLQFATDTAGCLQNGVFAAILAVIRQAKWQAPQAKLLITGGDAPLLLPFLADLMPETDALLVFRGMSQFIEK